MSDACMDHIKNHWKTLTTTSNEYFNKGDLDRALSGYKEALYRAEVLNNYQAGCRRLNIPFMQVYIISCNNLFNTYLELNRADDAENMLKRAVYYLLYLSRQGNINREETQNELKKASLVLLSFINKKEDKRKLLKDVKEQLEATLIRRP